MQPKIQPLGGGINIYTDQNHKFGTDAVLLSHFAQITGEDIACDLGTGCGIIPLLWCRETRPKKLTAVDIQQSAIELITASAEANGLCDLIDIRCADLRNLDADMGGKYTLVTMNPPYKRANDGAISPIKERAIARHELTCTVDDMAKSAARLLKPSGRLCVCHRPERLSDLMCAMRGADIEPKRLRLVAQRVGDAPMLVLCEGRRSGAAGLVIEPTLYIENEKGEHTAELQQIYRLFREESNR